MVGRKKRESGSDPEDVPDLDDPATRDVQLQRLDALRRTAQRAWHVPDPTDLQDFLVEAASVLGGLGVDPEIIGMLEEAARSPQDHAAQLRAGFYLIDVGVPELAVAPLSQAKELRPNDETTVDELALALDAVGALEEAARLYRETPSVLPFSASARAMYSHYAALVGDFKTVGALLPEIDEEQFGLFYDRADARAGRYACAKVSTPLDDADLRGWELVINGTLLIRTSDLGEEMNGRYAAVWDSYSQLAGVLDSMHEVLTRHRRAPQRVAFAPDRDSEILARGTAGRLGLAPPTPAQRGQQLSPDTLVVAYSWSSADQNMMNELAHDHTTILFGYAIDWTFQEQLAPDIVGLHAQSVVPPWGPRMKVIGEPGSPGAEVVNVPADDRSPHLVAQEIVTASPDPVGDQAALMDLMDNVLWSQNDWGPTTGFRDRYYPNNLVRSTRFL